MDYICNKNDFEQIFRQYYFVLCGIARSYVRNMAIVEEIVGDVFVRYWNNRQNIAIRISLKDYLFKSVRNACIDYLRKEQKLQQKTSSIDDPEVVCTTLTDLGEDPLDYLISAETERQILKAIDELPERYRQTLVLCRLEEMNYDEAAQVMGITKNTIKSNLREALAILMKKLKNLSIIILSYIIYFYL